MSSAWFRASRAVSQQSVPDMGVAIVFRPAQDAHIHKPPPLRELSLPMNSRMRAQNDVCFIFLG